MNCGGEYTAKKLYEWYCAQEIIATKRSHGSSNEARTVAARQRCAATGRYGLSSQRIGSDGGKAAASASGDAGRSATGNAGDRARKRGAKDRRAAVQAATVFANPSSLSERLWGLVRVSVNALSRDNRRDNRRDTT